MTSVIVTRFVSLSQWGVPRKNNILNLVFNMLFKG